MEDENTSQERKDGCRAGGLMGNMAFIESILEALGINGERISEKITAVEQAKENDDADAYLAALHELLDTIGESAETASPEIGKLRSEVVGIIRPIIDVLVKDSVIDIYAYIENARIEAAQTTLEAHKKMNELNAELIANEIECYKKKGLTKKEAIELIKTRLGRPQNISLSFPTTHVAAQAGSAKKSKKEIISDFVNLAQQDPEALIKAMTSMRESFAGSLGFKIPGMD
ncbi:MAG: hypothetical protein WC788_07060 [Candidatus Paceibacterota bacterium]|jgi:hypothetical protein